MFFDAIFQIFTVSDINEIFVSIVQNINVVEFHVYFYFRTDIVLCFASGAGTSRHPATA